MLSDGVLEPPIHWHPAWIFLNFAYPDIRHGAGLLVPAGELTAHKPGMARAMGTKTEFVSQER